MSASARAAGGDSSDEEEDKICHFGDWVEEDGEVSGIKLYWQYTGIS
jgi:hypothetical protein